jgi:hypothetical protein
MNHTERPEDKIPKGLYCYDQNGNCPYWSADANQPEQEYGHCAYLGWGDWEQEGLTLLWDQVKECGINGDYD